MSKTNATIDTEHTNLMAETNTDSIPRNGFCVYPSSRLNHKDWNRHVTVN